MNKQIEQIKAEIERRIDGCNPYAPENNIKGEAYENGRLSELLHFRNFIDVLPEETDLENTQTHRAV